MKTTTLSLISICLIFSSAVDCFAASNNSDNPKIHITPSGEMLEEELPSGSYLQPEWTAKRPFAQTRVYVLPEWQVSSEAGWDAKFPEKGKPQHLIQEEIEIGLPYRFQIDLENHDQRGLFIPEEEKKKQNANIKEVDDSWHHRSSAVELAYALGNWDEIFLNPVIKGEWKFNASAADNYEFKLLLGEELASRWHWALNLFFEQQIGDEREREFALSQALAYTVYDQLLNVGLEMKVSSESERDNRSKMEAAFIIGPTMQVRPSAQTHIDIAPLFGIGEEAPMAEVLVFMGIDFDADGEKGEISEPTSLRGK